MNFKTRVLYFPEKKHLMDLAAVLCDKLDCKSDKIPPAYPCENEKLVIIGVSTSKEVPDVLHRFCAQLGKQRAQNVAFYIEGAEGSATEMMNDARMAGANVIGDVFYCKGALLPFLAKVTPEEKKGIEEWLNKVLTQLK